MKRILVTGGTTFVSKYVAKYFLEHGYEVYVLNRNTKPQIKGIKLIEADRHDIGNELKDIYFDVVADITAYNESDITDLLDALGPYNQYIMLSSSAVYPETNAQPFIENSVLGQNKFWGQYGTDKIAAEKALLDRIPNAYILRPPYLYGAMNNVYREAFVFECALNDREFYLPKDGSMKLQFFHVRDLCLFIEKIITIKPKENIYNVGNKEAVSVKEWVKKCYACAGKRPIFINVYENIDQRNYFSFYNYEYALNVDKQCKILPDTMDFQEGLQEAYNWYIANRNEVVKKPFISYIDQHLRN